MKNITTRHISVFSLLIMLAILQACASPFANIGRTALKQYTVDYATPLSNNGLWDTNDVIIHYKTSEVGNSFSLSATMIIKDSIRMSFPAVESLRVYISYLDSDGKAIATHDISPFVPYRKAVAPELALTGIQPAPEAAVSFTFSYWGFFRSSMISDDNSADWEIFFNPFE